MSRFFVCLFLIFANVSAGAKNPIIPNMGVNDPHIRIIDGKAYLSASHDKSIENKQFIMEDWQLWSSDDLVSWKLESTLKPEQTYIGKPFTGCWATDIVKRNGKFYWYFSEKNLQTGVVVADSPAGPWTDPLGKPLLSSQKTPTHEYDMGIIQDNKGDFYIVFGVWDYYIAKLNEDMISLAEEPRLISIKNPLGPYNLDGNNTKMPTDDKPFIHSYNGKYYLSWGCFYAMAENIYGPYEYKGSILEKESFAPGYDSPTWPTGFKQGRHGSFFEWHNQWYFAYCDISQTGNRYFRDTFISYIHYKQNGEMATIRVDGIGVGEYDANKKIEAEDYYKASRLFKTENTSGGFSISGIQNNDFLIFNKVKNLENKTKIHLNATIFSNTTIELRKNTASGKLIKKITLQKGTSNPIIQIGALENTVNLVFVFKGKNGNLLDFNYCQFK
jgi:arabinoxylan arabinofuranohydrolase